MTAPGLLSSRPLRATAVVLSGWVAMRTVMLWPEAATAEGPVLLPLAPIVPDLSGARDPDLDRAMAMAAKAGEAVAAEAAVTTADPQTLAGRQQSDRQIAPPAPARRNINELRVRHAALAPSQARPPSPTLAQAPPAPVVFAAAPPSNAAGPPDDAAAPPVIDHARAALAFAPVPSPRTAGDRFQASGWLLVRGGEGVQGSLAPSGTLGGSQAGVRVFYEPGPKGLALTARVSAPLSTAAGREASLGIALRAGAVGLIVEERVAIDRGGRTMPSVTAYGGIYDRTLPGGLRASGYIQAGVVGLRDPQGFADGQLRVERAVARAGPVAVTLGASVSGGVQPGLARLDLGPEIAAHMPLAKGTMRLAFGWRARAAGSAAPGSGLALSVGMDF